MRALLITAFIFAAAANADCKVIIVCQGAVCQAITVCN